MSLARIKTWIPGEVLTATDLNSEFNNPLDNALSMISPLTGTLDVDGNQLTLDAAGDTTVVSSAAVSWNFTSGNKTGTPATTGSVVNYSAQTFTDNATAASGTAAAYTGFALQRPTLAASNATVTTTNAATFYIPNNVAAGTNETITNSWSLWVDAGNVRFDDDVYWLSGTSFNGILAHNNTAARTYTFPDTTGTVALDTNVLALSGGTMTGDITMSGASIIEAEGASIASAGTTEIWTTDGNTCHITGTTTITSFGTAAQAGMWKKLIFDGALTLTNGANLILPTSGNITTAANDIAYVYADTTTQHNVIFFRKSGLAIAPTAATLGTEQTTTSGTAWDFTIPADIAEIKLMFFGVSTNGTSGLLLQIGDSGGIETTGYDSTVNTANSTIGFIITPSLVAAGLCCGCVTLHLENRTNFQWIATGVTNGNGTLYANAGEKALSAELTTVRVTTVNGTDTFDAGKMRVSYSY